MKKILYLVLIISLIFLLVGIDLEASYKYIGQLSLGLILSLASLQLLTMGLLAVQWDLIIGLKRPRNLIGSLVINSYGNLIDGLTPGAKVGGEISRAYRISKEFNLDMEEAGVLVGLQKTISLLSFLLLYTIGLGYFSSYLPGRLGLRIVLGHIGLVLLTLGIYRLIGKNLGPTYRLLKKLGVREEFLSSLRRALEDYKSYIRIITRSKSYLFKHIILGLAIWILYPIKMYIISSFFKIGTPFPLLISITYISYMLGMLPLLPASLGSFQASMTYLFSLKGLAPYKGLGISTVFRFFTFWFEILLSIFIIFITRIIRRVKVDKIQIRTKVR